MREPSSSRIPFRLDGRTAVVTGGGRGIGAAIVRVLADAGAQVVSLDSARPNAPTDRVEHVDSDVSDPASVQRAFAYLDREVGPVDILVNNAGTSSAIAFEDLTAEEWDRVLGVNARGSFLCAKAFLDRVATTTEGRIIQIASVVAHQGALYGQAHYAASKSAQLGLTKTLSRLAAPHGVTVNAVAPGVIETDLSGATLGADRLRQQAADIPLGLGCPADVAYAVLYLASAEARYVTGATLDVNGGMYAR